MKNKKGLLIGCVSGGCILPVLAIVGIYLYLGFTTAKSNANQNIPVEMAPSSTKSNGTFQLKYLGAFITKKSDNPTITENWLKEGESLITIAFQFENITDKNFKPQKLYDDFSLKSPKGSVYTPGFNGFLYDCCLSSNNFEDMGFRFEGAGYIADQDYPPAVKNNYVASFVISQKEFEESSGNWTITIPMNAPFVISIPKEKFLPLGNWLEFDAIVKTELGIPIK